MSNLGNILTGEEVIILCSTIDGAAYWYVNCTVTNIKTSNCR